MSVLLPRRTSRKRGAVVIAQLVSLALACGVWAGEPRTKESLAALVARIPKVAKGDSGISKEETALAKAIQSHKAAAIPLLIPLLDDERASVRTFTGYVLRDIEGLDETHLDALISARQRGDGWIPPAIARVGSPRAVEFLIGDLQAHPQTHTQTTWALRLLGDKAAAPLAGLLRGAKPIPRELADAICHVFSEMEGEAADPAVDPLLAIVANATTPEANRLAAIRSLGCIGLAARRAVPALRALAGRTGGATATAADQAIRGIGSPETVPAFVQGLQTAPSVGLLCDLAEIRENGHDAGPAVVALLSAPDWDIRVAAARTLGYIGYEPAAEPLVKQLDNPDDWRLVYVATESLGRLRAGAATAALQKVTKAHWFAPVREAARTANAAIAGKHMYKSRWHPKNFTFEFFEYEQLPAHGERPESPEVRGRRPNELGAGELAGLAYDSEVVGWGVDGKHVKPIKQRPQCGLKVKNGYLLGASRGEWGGELVYSDGKSQSTKLLDKNVVGIHEMPFGILAVTGLAHLSMNQGDLYLVRPEDDGRYAVTAGRHCPVHRGEASVWRTASSSCPARTETSS